MITMYNNNDNEFITKWAIYSPVLFKLPLIKSGSYNFDIDWGDFSPVEHISCYNVVHRYSRGYYTIKIKGLIKGIRASDDEQYQLIDIMRWGCVELGNNGNYFNGCRDMKISAIDAPNLSHTTNLSHMFAECLMLNCNINHWNVSTITDMSHMFSNAVNFDKPLDKWDVSNVRNMDFMFYRAHSFNHTLSNWDTSNVTSMSYMFNNTHRFNQDISNWNVSNVRFMDNMFCNNRVFNQPIGKWNVSKVTTFKCMFTKAERFNQDVSSWNMSSCNDVSRMFEDATDFIKGNNLLKLQHWNSNLLQYILGYNKLPSNNFLIDWDNWNNKTTSIDTCSICLSDIIDYKEWRAINCFSTNNLGIAHCFHNKCIETALKLNMTCPICRGIPVPIL